MDWPHTSLVTIQFKFRELEELYEKKLPRLKVSLTEKNTHTN